ncbi:MAG TPA: hypothetical protein PKJ71_08705, partial [Bacteroidales bacterium]|nr:hypothetical protein [Bacteroidales bacterium]
HRHTSTVSDPAGDHVPLALWTNHLSLALWTNHLSLAPPGTDNSTLLTRNSTTLTGNSTLLTDNFTLLTGNNHCQKDGSQHKNRFFSQHFSSL